MLPDGRRINYGKNGVTIGAPPVALGTRVNPTTYHQPSNSALTNSFLRADAVPPYNYQDDRYNQLSHQAGLENGLPTIDTTYSSNPASVYGSPRDEDSARFGFGLSPINAKGLSVMDAPLPASFDSQGISHAARYGPWPSSVPSKFGLESPSQSLGTAKDARTSEALKLLHHSAFGTPEGNGLGSSPPTSNTYTSALASEEYFGKRAMHSNVSRFAKPRLLSSSAPKIDRDWEHEFLFEEDYVPATLANEVLTPAEKARRGSTNIRAVDGESYSESIPTTTGIKFGSPAMAGSPSRWGSLFQRQKEEEAAQAQLEMSNAGGYSIGSGRPGSMKHAASAFGHVGSPLRNSSLASGIADQLNGDRPGVGSRQGSDSLSTLSQQFQRTRLGDDGPIGGSSGSPRLHPNAARVSGISSGLGSIGAGVIGKERERERGLERHISSGSIGSGRFTTPIDEEDSSFVFSMEEEDSESSQSRARKRASGAGGIVGATSPLGNGYLSYGDQSLDATVNGSGNMNGGSGGHAETVGGR